MFLLPLAWTIFCLFLGVTISRNARAHARPELGMSTRDNYREKFFARFIRRMSFTAVCLCVISALVVWSSFTWAVILLLAIPAVAALQIARGKRAIEASGNRSLMR